MKKPQDVTYVVLSSLIQLISIIVFYQVIYRIARVFHEPYVRTGGDGMDFYGFTLMYVGWLVIICVILTTIIQEIFKTEFIISSIHAMWILFIVWDTWTDLERHPYDYGLILFCISLSLPMRVIIRKFLHA